MRGYTAKEWARIRTYMQTLTLQQARAQNLVYMIAFYGKVTERSVDEDVIRQALKWCSDAKKQETPQ